MSAWCSRSTDHRLPAFIDSSIEKIKATWRILKVSYSLCLSLCSPYFPVLCDSHFLFQACKIFTFVYSKSAPTLDSYPAPCTTYTPTKYSLHPSVRRCTVDGSSWSSLFCTWRHRPFLIACLSPPFYKEEDSLVSGKSPKLPAAPPTASGPRATRVNTKIVVYGPQDTSSSHSQGFLWCTLSYTSICQTACLTHHVMLPFSDYTEWNMFICACGCMCMRNSRIETRVCFGWLESHPKALVEVWTFLTIALMKCL